MKAFETWVGFLLMLILCLLLIFIKVIIDERAECLQNPIGYGIKNVEELTNYSFRCLCSSDKPGTEGVLFTRNGSSPFRFTEEGIRTNLTFDLIQIRG